MTRIRVADEPLVIPPGDKPPAGYNYDAPSLAEENVRARVWTSLRASAGCSMVGAACRLART